MTCQRSLLVIPEFLDRRQHEELALRAETAGLSALWYSELAYDVHAYEQLGLMSTERLHVGSCVAVRHKRHPVLAAETAATLNFLFPGRYVLGLGTGASEPFSGGPEDHIVGRMDEYIEVVRAVLKGGPVEFHGKYYDADYRTPSPHGDGTVLAHVPRQPIPIYIAGGGQMMLSLAGRCADGVFIQHFGCRRVLAQQVETVQMAARQAGRESGSVAVLQIVQVCIDDDRERARESFRNYLALYFQRSYYRKLLADGGFADESVRLERLWERGTRDTVATAISDEVLDACGLAGTPEEVRARIDDFIVAGVDEVVLYPSPIGHAAPEDDWFAMYCRTVAALAPG
jgi:alkanesulfonate monooxygenase SsuD/methylene tetrahydromethanopterin reductase-like flavin-dependent oxidoreductase (luciferase family)